MRVSQLYNARGKKLAATNSNSAPTPAASQASILENNDNKAKPKKRKSLVSNTRAAMSRIPQKEKSAQPASYAGAAKKGAGQQAQKGAGQQQKTEQPEPQQKRLFQRIFHR